MCVCVCVCVCARVRMLVQFIAGCQVLTDAGVLQAALPLLHDKRCVRVLCVVRMCESMLVQFMGSFGL